MPHFRRRTFQLPPTTIVRIVQPPSCATPADVDLRSTLSVVQSLSTIICNVSISRSGSSFNVQSPVPMRYLQMRFALCISRAEGLCTFIREKHQLSHMVRYCLCSAGPSFGSSFGTLDSDLTTWSLHMSAASHASTGQQTVKKFRKRLDLKPSL